MNASTTGILLAALGGICVGNCMLPLKRIRIWPWECTWLVFSLVSLLFVPCVIAVFVVPGWPRLYTSLSPSVWLPSLWFGFGWGIAQALFGVSVVRLGMSLAFTVIVGLGTVFGTLIPLVMLHREVLFSRNSAFLIAGCGLMVFGVVLSGIAGSLRERRGSFEESGKVPKASAAYLVGLGLAILSGVLSSMLNLSLAFGEPIARAALAGGTAAANAAFAVWPVALAGGLIPNLAFSIWLLGKNRTWKLLKEGWQDALLSLLMGLLWVGAVAVYGVSTRYLGKLGDSAGWAIYQVVMVLTANAAGLFAGEWKQASRRSVVVLASGVLVLILATVTTAVSTR